MTRARKTKERLIRIYDLHANAGGGCRLAIGIRNGHAHPRKVPDKLPRIYGDVTHNIRSSGIGAPRTRAAATGAIYTVDRSEADPFTDRILQHAVCIYHHATLDDHQHHRHSDHETERCLLYTS